MTGTDVPAEASDCDGECAYLDHAPEVPVPNGWRERDYDTGQLASLAGHLDEVLLLSEDERIGASGKLAGSEQAGYFARFLIGMLADDGYVLVPGPVRTERCRECRDESEWLTPVPLADFILWGKLLPPEALGPRCTDHAVKWLPRLLEQPDQHAVFNLRPLRPAPESTPDGAGQ